MARVRTAAVLACIVAALLGCAAAQSTRPTQVFTRADIMGNDLGCNQYDYNQPKPLPYCKLCDGFANAEDTCRLNDKCKAFTSDGYCFYLKTAAAPRVYREGYYVAVP